jgi:hypothetical protein
MLWLDFEAIQDRTRPAPGNHEVHAAEISISYGFFSRAFFT